MRSFEYHDINEMGNPIWYVDGKAHPRFSFEQRMLENTNPNLMANVMKVFAWIKENCPNLSGEFHCRHNPYYKIHLIVKNGKAYLCEGSHGCGYATYLSAEESATYSQGSCQGAPYAFKGVYFFRNDRLEEFLSQWSSIKNEIIAKNKLQENVYSNEFVA